MYPPDLMVVHRPRKGAMAWLFNRVMPTDNRPTFVWPRLVVAIEDTRHFDRRELSVIAVVLIVMTIATIKALLFIPGLDSSVVELLTSIFATFLPARWATGAAWVAGVAGVLLIGDFTNYTKQQKALHSLKVCFGLAHVVNIWYSFAAGTALSMTGFGFLLVYLWYYRKYRSQIVATAAAATLHTLYNVIALSLIAAAAVLYMAISVIKML